MKKIVKILSLMFCITLFMMICGCMESTPSVNQYTVTFKDYDGTILREEIIQHGKNATTPEDPTRDGYIFIGWDGEYLNVQKDTILIALYEKIQEEIKEYTVTFKDYDGSVLKEEKVEEGQNATAPNDPSREGYNFIGWDKEYTNVQSDLEIIAQYEEIIVINKYTVTFVDYNGNILKEETVEEGQNATAPNDPTREGYNFIGWSFDYTNIKTNLIVIAQYELINQEVVVEKYTVAFVTNSDTVIAPQEVEKGNKAIEPATPVRKGYIFEGWYLNDEKWNFIEYEVTEDIVLVAKWNICTYQITYDLNGGYYVGSYREQVINDFLADCALHKGVSVEEIPFDSAANWQGNWAWGTFFATTADNGKNPAYPSAELPSFWNVPANREKWLWLLEAIYDCMLAYPGGDTYTTSLSHIENAMNNNFCGSHQTITYAFWYFLNGKTHQYFGFNFADTDDDGVNNSEKYISRHYGNFLTYTVEDEITLKKPTKVGHTFIGWTSNEIEEPQLNVTFSNEINDKHFIANYIANTYQLVFDTDGGNETYENIEITYDNEFDITSYVPTKTEHIFLGWYNGDEEITKGTWKYTNNITVKAKWFFCEKKEVIYNLDGGILPEDAPKEYIVTIGLDKLPIPTKEGYNFAGWFTDEQCTKIITSIDSNFEEDVYLYALWEEVLENKELIVDANNPDAYATYEAAETAAIAGDTIKIVAGTYTTITITKSVNIHGANAGVNPNQVERADETVFTGDVVIAADNVTIDGIKLTENGRIKGHDNGVSNPTITNIVIKDSLTNPEVSSSYNAPLFFYTYTAGAVYENIVISNIKQTDSTNGRPMIFFGGQIDGLTIKNSDFNVSKKNWNDGIKITTDDADSHEGEYGIKGDVKIVGNYFENFDQYPIWFINYQEGSYEILNNIFKNCGQTESSHCAVRMGTYTGAADGKSPVSFLYNTVDNSYSLYRSNTNASRNAETQPVLVNYNKLLNCSATYYVNNACEYKVDARYNYYDTAVLAGSFLNAEYEPYYANEDEVPVYDSEDDIYMITYDLDGAILGNAPRQYSSKVGVTELPVPTKDGYEFEGWLLNGELITEIAIGTTGNLKLIAKFKVFDGEIYNIEYVTNKENPIWPTRAAYDRFEIYDALYADLYEWAQGNGETKSFEEYKAYIDAELAGYVDINLRNTKLGNNPDEDGSTEYFLNVPKFFKKWSDFFAVFAEAMKSVHSGQDFYTDTYATMVRMHQFLHWTSTGEGYFKSFLPRMCSATKIPQEIQTTYRDGQTVVLPELSMENGLEFLGWYDNAEFSGDAITQIVSTDTGDKKFYAKWAEEVKVETVEINTINELLLFTTHQLVWTLSPNNITDNSVEFFSSNEEVATITNKGLITALTKGTTTITMKVYGNREKDVVFDLTVYTDDFIDGAYYTNSYVEKDDSIQLLAEVVRKDRTKAAVKWSSLTPEIATVDENGVVTALKAGTAKIVATDPNNETLTLEFVVTVFDEMPEGILDLALRANESNAFKRYDLNIGGAYSMDILGSVSKLLTNTALTINNNNYINANEAVATFGKMESIEFITVHNTDEVASGANAFAFSNYYIGQDSISRHYIVGNDGVYSSLDESMSAWHCGDGGALSLVGKFQWIPTGVMAGTNDPKYPVFSISNDYYFEINGQKTSVEMPKPWNYSSRGTDHILNGDGTLSSQANFSQTGFANRDADEFINDQDLPFKVVDGEYYMGTTWWCYTQVYEGRICSTGGNRNSIAIDTCVNQGSDLWLTWQKTAQLVADIMLRNNLDITRVKGRHFFNAKNNPQPMLENDLEIWWEFIELVEAEYELLTVYEGYEVTMVSNNSDIVDNCGRVIKQPAETTCVTYTITFTKDGNSQSITLSSMVDGLYVDR